MGSVGDEPSHDAVSKESHDLKPEVHGDEGSATQKPQQVQEAAVQAAEGVDIQSPEHAHKAEPQEAEVQEAQEAAAQEVQEADTQVAQEADAQVAQEVDAQEAKVKEAEAQEAEPQEAETQEAEAQEAEVEEAGDLATQNPTGVEQAHEAEVHKAEELEQNVSVSAVMAAGIGDRDTAVPKVRRKLPEVKRFSARRSVVAEDPKPKVDDGVSESKSPSIIRKQRGVQRLSARMNMGIDDRDTVDYGAVSTEDLKPVVKEVAAPKQQLSVAERERLRLLGIRRNKDIVCLERIRGKLVNITQGLELHTGVFSRVEQNKLVDLVRELQAKGRRQELKDRTYSEPRKWMRGKGRVTLQFGCCYNYAVDKNGNPPGILREDVVDPIPPLLRTTIKRLVRWHVLPPSCVPDSCIINMYEEGDCIPPHIDHHDFLRPFCTLSLLSECNIVFGANLEILGPGDFGGNLSLPLPVGSVLVLNGNGADVAKHAVPAVPTERISITFRKMDPSKVPVGFTLDTELQSLKPVSLPS